MLILATESDPKKMTGKPGNRSQATSCEQLLLETSYIERLCAGRKGAMTNLDIRNFAEHMREKLFIKNTAPLIYAQKRFFPAVSKPLVFWVR